MPHLHGIRVLALVVVVVMLAGCNENPAEVRDDATTFPLRANWSATAAPIGSSAVSATLAVKQYHGFRNEAALTIAGTPSGIYQWRIFRGDCTTNTPAANNTAQTGLLLFATVESYPDITAGAGGTGTATPEIAGSLDSLTAYSVRIRPSQAAANWNGTNPIACGDLQYSSGS